MVRTNSRVKWENVAYLTRVKIFFAAENENRQLEGLLQADFGRLPERFLLSVRIKSIK